MIYVISLLCFSLDSNVYNNNIMRLQYILTYSCIDLIIVAGMIFVHVLGETTKRLFFLHRKPTNEGKGSSKDFPCSLVNTIDKRKSPRVFVALPKFTLS